MFSCVVTLLGASSVVLCSCGHGRYTTEAKKDSEKRLSQLKSATQFDLATQQYESGDLDRSLRTIEQSIALTPDVARPYLLKARILIEMGRTEEALSAIDKGADLAPDSADFYYFRGVALEGVGRTDGAIEAYARAADLDTSDLQYVLAHAEVLIESGRSDEAREVLTAAAEEFQFSPGLRQLQGHLAMIAGDAPGAVEHFQQAALLGPDDPSLLEDLAGAQIAAGRFSDAEKTLERLTANPKYRERRDVLHMRARCLVETGRPAEARKILTRLTEQKSGASDAEAWVRMCEVAVMMNDDRLLRSSAARVLTIAPERYEGYLAQAMWQRRAGDLEAALRSTERAIERAPAQSAPLRMKGLLLKQMGDTPAAEQAMSAAHAIDGAASAR